MDEIKSVLHHLVLLLCGSLQSDKMADIPLKNLNPQFKQGSVLVRGSRVWEFRGGTDEGELKHIDIVFINAEGFPMYAEIGQDAFNTHISTFTKQNIYRLQRFTVTPTKQKYRPIDSRFMIQITVHTIVTECNNTSPTIPLYTYKLTDLANVAPLAGTMQSFVDVLGLITEVGTAHDYYVQSMQTTTKRRIVTIKDNDNYEMKVYLWGNIALTFDAEYVHKLGQEEAVVVIFVGLLVKSSQGNIFLSTNAPTRWYINVEVPEVSAFIDRLPDDFAAVTIAAAQQPLVLPPEPLAEAEHRTLEEVKHTSPYEFPAQGFRIIITVSKIKQNVSWFFASCNICSKACTYDGSSYKCNSCGCTGSRYKYKICLYATDGTAEAEFIFFGEMGRRLVGRDLPLLMRTAPQAGQTPMEIAALVSHKYELTVGVTSRAFQRVEYSYQVRAINRAFGRQPQIPPAPIAEPIPALPPAAAARPSSHKGKRKIDERRETSATQLNRSGDLTFPTDPKGYGATESELQPEQVEQQTPPPTDAYKDVTPPSQPPPTASLSDMTKTGESGRQSSHDSKICRSLFKEEPAPIQTRRTTQKKRRSLLQRN